MQLNCWKSVIVSWANALNLSSTKLNFIDDLSPKFFISLCSYLKGNDVSSLQEAANYITDYYKSLILGNSGDDVYVALLATMYLLLTSVHQTNDELCNRLCSVSVNEQALIKTVLEAFINVQPAKITKELIFMTLAQLPDGRDSFGDSPYLASSGSGCSPNQHTPGTDDDSPNPGRRRRSSRFKKVKHQLHLTMSLKNTLQDELDSARETISNLESIVLAKNQDIAQLKERNQRLMTESEADRSGVFSGCQTPVHYGRDCVKCHSLERQISTYEEYALQDKSEIQRLTESLASLTKKIKTLESDKRKLDDQLQMYEEQILKNNEEISTLQLNQDDLMRNKKELECIIEELREVKTAADCSLEGDLPVNLGKEIIDLQLGEMRQALEEKVQDIANLHVKLAENGTVIEQLQKFISSLELEVAHTITVVQQEQEKNEALVQEMVTLELGFEERCSELEREIAVKEEAVSSLEKTAQHITESLQQEMEVSADLKEECKTLMSCLKERSTEVTLLKDEISRNRSAIQGLQLENESCRAEIRRLENDAESLRGDYNLATAQLVDVQKRGANIEEELQESKQRIVTLSKALETQVDGYRELEVEYKKQEEVLRVKDEQLSCLGSDVFRITTVVQQEKQKNEGLVHDIDKLKLEFKERCCDLEKEICIKKETIASLEKTAKLNAESLQREVEETTVLKKECHNLMSSLDGKSAEITVLKNEITRLQENNKLCKAEILHLQNDGERLTSDYELTASKLVALQKLKENIDEQLEESQLRVAALSGDLATQVREFQELKLVCKEQEEVLTMKNEQICCMESEVAHISTVVKQVQEMNEALVQELDTLKLGFEERCSKLEREVAVKEETISSLEKTAQRIAESLQQEMEASTALKEECKTLESSLNEKCAEITLLQDDIIHRQSAIQSMEQEKELCNAKILGLQNDAESLNRDLKLTTSQLVDLQKLKENIEEQLQESQLRVAALSDNLATQVEEFRELEIVSKQQEELLTVKNEQLSCLEREVACITSVVQKEQEKNKTLVQELNTLKLGFEKRCSKFEREVAVKEETISSLEKTAQHIAESLQQEMEASTALKEECKTLESSLNEKCAEITLLKDEITENQSAIRGLQQENESCKAEVLRWQNDFERLTGDYKSVTTQLVDVQKLKGKIEEQLQESQSHTAALSKNLETQVEEFRELESMYKQREEVLSVKNEHLSCMESEVARITAVVQQKREKNEALIQQMESLKLGFEKRCSELEREVAVKKETISSLEKMTQSITESLRQEVEVSTGLNLKCGNIWSLLNQKDASIIVLEDEIARTQSTIQGLQQENELRNAEILRLQNDNVRLAGEYEHANTQLFEERKYKKGIEQQLEKSQQRCATISEELDVQKEDFCKLDVLFKEQVKELMMKVDQLSSMENEAIHNQLIKQEMEQENRKLQGRICALEVEVSKLSQSNEVTDAKLLQILEQKNTLEERLTSHENDLKEKFQREVIALQTALDKEKALVLVMDEDRKCHESLKHQIEVEKEYTQSVIRSLQDEVKKLINDNESATSLVNCLKTETESLTRRLENCNMDLDIKNETILMMETTLSSLNSKLGLLEATIKEKDLDIAGAQEDLHNTKIALEKYRAEGQRQLHSRIDEMQVVIQHKDAELAKLRKENESKCERIAKMAEELVQVSQTFNVEKASLADHAKNLEEMLESSTSIKEQLQTEVKALSNQLRLKEDKLLQLEEKLLLNLELHNSEKGDLTSKNKFLKTQMDEIKLKYDRLVKELEDCNVEQLKGHISKLEAERRELNDKLELKSRDIQWYTHELEVLRKSAKDTMKVNCQLEEEVKSLTKSKKQEIARLEKEIVVLKEKAEQKELCASDISSKLRQEYEEKLEKLKAKMRKVYTEKMEAMMKFNRKEEEALIDEELKKERQKRHALESKIRELSDQLLIIQEEKRSLISNNVFRAPAYPLGGPMSNPAYESPPSMYKAHSLDRLPISNHGVDNLGADLSLDQSFSFRRTSTSSNRSNHLPKGIGKVFPAAEEEGEVFDNRCLTDLKDGICTLPSSSGGVDRMSILQQRNSMCPPHLKSSYPVESQFFAPNAKEDEIKVITKGKENVPEESRSVAGTPSKLRSLFSGRRKH